MDFFLLIFFLNDFFGLFGFFLKLIRLLQNLGGGGNQGRRLYREEEYFNWPCSRKRVPDQEGRPVGHRQSGAGAGKRFLILFRLIGQDQDLVIKKGKTHFRSFFKL